MKLINKVGMICILILLIIVIFVDNNSLNSLFMKSEDIDINEVAIVNVDYNKVIYNENETKPTQTENTPTTNNANVEKINNAPATNYWSWPTEKDYTITTYFSASHPAIDIYSYKGNGSNIYAANSGTVTLVKTGCIPGNLACNGRGGNYIVIKHNQNNYYTVYMHLKNIYVNVGDTVTSGQVIGTMGNTGNVIPVPTSTSPYNGTHLHFCLYVGEPYKGGYAINPMRLY